jgi:hypothetical protein
MFIAFILYIPLYLILSSFPGIKWATYISLPLALIFAFLLTRRSWERKIIKGLPEDQQDYFFECITISDEAINRIIESEDSPLEKKKRMYEYFSVSAIDGLVDLSPEEANEVMSVLKENNSDPLNNSFVREMDRLYSDRYREKFKHLKSNYQRQKVTVSIPFPRMYEWIMKTRIDLAKQFLSSQQ